MEILGHLLLSFLVLSHVQIALGGVCQCPLLQPVNNRMHIIGHDDPLPETYGLDSLNRTCFPDGFVFGAATSAYQVEGAWNVDGRTPSIWDNYTHTYPDRIPGDANGDVAIDSYHLYEKDIERLKDMNMDAYRFSISWSRVLPHGTISLGVNEKGIDYYNKLINETLRNGKEPFVTMFHFDVPQVLEDKYGGFRNRQIVEDYLGFAELCFERFGDRVKHWITINEPFTLSTLGYALGDNFPPQRCSAWINPNCTGGDSATEPYLVTHNFLLAHAHAVNLYKTKYQAKQGGIIGITLNSNWLVPLTNSSADQEAFIRGFDFMLGWFLEPLVFGHYPDTMRRNVGSRLPEFNQTERMLVKGSYDFIGINYYTATYVANGFLGPPSFSSDQKANYPVERDGVPIGNQAASDWLYVYPEGIFELLRYVKENYNDPIIYITENGVDAFNHNSSMLGYNTQQDGFRIKYHYLHLCFILKAIHEAKVQVKGYFGWSLVDNFEFTGGYSVRFGLNFVNFKTMERTPKLSANWFKEFLKIKT